MRFNHVIIIDKPPGHTSHEITTFVKKITCASRAGHAGTLDPQVSGVLPVALGRATKLLQYIAGKDKTYVGVIKFKEPQPKERIEELFAEFTGEILQTPPKKSAVRKRPRKRTVHHLRLLEISAENPRLALFEAKVDAGTYIRSLCVDIGKKCGGARMEELRRIAVGGIGEAQCHSIYEVIDAMHALAKGDSSLLDEMLKAPETFITLPKVLIKKSALESVLSGAQIMPPGIEGMDDCAEDSRVAIYCDNEFVGVGVRRGRKIVPERIHFQKTG
jgi:H/ACA ribonucleoprotein complex subunit 4